ncbi:S41 family peptidase [Pseudoalteromonas sp. MMG024]|uniref:S41 family peptidase n=1 Tax=Pseudoalteromonas sp. MMG024 TaxID=2909980 RepID=UPI001F212D56|nr:S41 family peptidase [Pseudoalteromonas sp. MMG024]MCF6456844.1 S41 family peptidase [Pseudoalteromonas sp. MMG024]
MTFFLNSLKICALACLYWVSAVSADAKTTSHISMAEVLANIEHFYVDDIDANKLNQHAIESIFKQLDPHSEFLDQTELEALFNVANGRYTGLGIEVEQREKHIVIVAAIENSPAQTAGLTKGDILLKVNDISVINQPIKQVSKLINQQQKPHVKLTIARNGHEQPLLFEVERKKIDLKSVKGNINSQGIAYLRIINFNNHTLYDVAKELAHLSQIVAGEINGLIIDLRDNPGGILDSAIEVSDLFLESGVIVSTKGRFAEANQEYYAQEGDVLGGAPIIVLINEGSASAAEILAGALQDNQRAQLVGTRSYGKGSVQSLIPLGDGQTALKLTTAKYYTPSGRSIEGSGILPDHPVLQHNFAHNGDFTEPQTETFINAKVHDLQLEKAWQLLEK